MCSPMLMGYAHAAMGMLNGLVDANTGNHVSTIRLYASLRSNSMRVVIDRSLLLEEFDLGQAHVGAVDDS